MDDLRKPRYRVEEGHDRVVRARLPVAHDQAGEIDGEEAGRMHRIGT